MEEMEQYKLHHNNYSTENKLKCEIKKHRFIYNTYGISGHNYKKKLKP